MSAGASRLLGSPPPADDSHLELRFDTCSPGEAAPTPESELAAFLPSATRARVTTLDVVLRGADLSASIAPAVARLVERLPALAGLTLTLTGRADPAAAPRLAAMLHGHRPPDAVAAVHLVLEADASVFAALGHTGGPGENGLGPPLETSRHLRREGIVVRWIVPIVPALAPRLEAIFSLARDESVDPVLMPAGLVDPAAGPLDVGLDDDDRLLVADFIRYRLLDEEATLHPPHRLGFYQTVAAALDGGSEPAGPARRVTVLRAVSTPSGFRAALAREDRPHGAPLYAGGPSAGRSRLDRLRGPASAGGEVLREGCLALAAWARAGAARRAGTPPAPAGGRRLSRVLLVGAYGGEHIGDLAILGGVLVRLNRRYGTTAGTLMSQRPRHTRHLVSMLDTPFTIDVAPYEPAAVREHLPGVDAVVFAGGPLIDLPRQLVKHLYTASLARRSGKPFIMEGIGPGPFPRRPSEWTARAIVAMAERISVRTSSDARHRLMQGRPVEVGRDPAFDYLATRGPELTRLRKADRQWIERLTEGSEGRLRIGINLRPIRHLFTVGVPLARRGEHTRRVERQFEGALAEGMRRFHQACARPPCFVFFPMNAIQFGMSDLRSAYRLQRALGAGLDVRVWEADASLDGVVALLRRLDLVIAMRFHATIFALSQERRVIGIDYRVGERDKVGALLEDFGQSENCARIDQVTPEWVYGRLLALAGQPRDAHGPIAE